MNAVTRLVLRLFLAGLGIKCFMLAGVFGYVGDGMIAQLAWLIAGATCFALFDSIPRGRRAKESP